MFQGRKVLGVALFAALTFLTLGVLVRYSFLQNLDLRATKELQEHPWPPLQALMIALTFTGSPAVVPIVGALTAFVLWRTGLPRGSGLVLLSLLAVPANVVLKTIWDRARPDAEIVRVAVKTAGSSFPSGHAMGGTAFYGALAALAWIHLERQRARLPLTVFLAGLPFAIDASRIYLGAHWTSDVVGGSAVGLLILVLALRWYLGGLRGDESGEASPVPEP